MPNHGLPKNVDEYIAASAPQVRHVLKRLRATIRAVAPTAQERIRYGMPAFFLMGALVYFAAFKNHIGLYPPVTGDSKLAKAAARYAGPKGNLRFPLAQPIPYELVARIVRLRAQQNSAMAMAKRPHRLTTAWNVLASDEVPGSGVRARAARAAR